jgi:hypothetical protein
VPRQDKVDPWFLKPYEPSVAAVPAGNRDQGNAALPGAATANKPQKNQVAALLGGSPKRGG